MHFLFILNVYFYAEKFLFAETHAFSAKGKDIFFLVLIAGLDTNLHITHQKQAL